MRIALVWMLPESVCCFPSGPGPGTGNDLERRPRLRRDLLLQFSSSHLKAAFSVELGDNGKNKSNLNLFSYLIQTFFCFNKNYKFSKNFCFNIAFGSWPEHTAQLNTSRKNVK